MKLIETKEKGESTAAQPGLSLSSLLNNITRKERRGSHWRDRKVGCHPLLSLSQTLQ